MSTSEDYLDQLLRSVNEKDKELADLVDKVDTKTDEPDKIFTMEDEESETVKEMDQEFFVSENNDMVEQDNPLEMQDGILMKDEISIENEKAEPVIIDLPEQEEPLMDEMPEPEEPVMDDLPEPEEHMIDEMPESEEHMIDEKPEPEEPVIDEMPEPEENVMDEMQVPEEPVIDEKPKPEEPVMDEMQVPEEPVIDDIQAMEDAMDIIPTEETITEELPEMEQPIMDETSVEEEFILDGLVMEDSAQVRQREEELSNEDLYESEPLGAKISVEENTNQEEFSLEGMLKELKEDPDFLDESLENEEFISINQNEGTFTNSLNEVKDMSEDEIASILKSIDDEQSDLEVVQENEKEESFFELEEDENVSEINDLIDKSNNYEPVSNELEQLLSENNLEFGEDLIENLPESEVQELLSNEEEDPKAKKGKKAKKEKGEKKSLFGRKKKKPEAETFENLQEDEFHEPDDFNLEDEKMGIESEQKDDSMSELDDLLGNLIDNQESDNSGSANDDSLIDLFGGLEETEELETMDDELSVEEAEALLEERSKPEKKKGIFARFINFITEEDDEELESQVASEMQQLGSTSEENEEVLKQLAKEDKANKKKKKKDKKGKEKGKAEDSEDDGDGEDEEDGKKGKSKKPKKEKKKKEPKPVDDTPEPKLSRKKVSITFLFSFSIMIAIILACMFIPDIFTMTEARKAYYDGNYEQCFKTMYGKKLNESDELIYKRSEMILKIERKLANYNHFVERGEELYALDQLLLAVAQRDELMESAKKYGVEDQAEFAYQQALAILLEKYNLTEEDALEINGYEEDAIYTLRLKAIVDGTEFVLPDFLSETAAPQETVVDEDLLPEEEELIDAAVAN